MIEFLIANMAPIIFGSLVVFLVLGFPAAFALAANGIIFGWIGIVLGLFQPTFFQRRAVADSDLLGKEQVLERLPEIYTRFNLAVDSHAPAAARAAARPA